jgi:Mrp family chromosome partitioning ATPase
MDINQSVLLVDMDLLNPKVAWYFNLNVKNTLKDCLMSDIPLADVLMDPGIDRLKIIPGKGKSNFTSELISSPKMQNIIADMKNNLEAKIIIFDLPPILVADDVLASIDYYDALLFVVEDGANSAKDIKKSLQMVADKPFLGTVLNKSEDLINYQDYYYSD